MFMYKKDPKEPIFWSGQLEPAWRGAVAGGALFLRTLAVTGSNPAMCVRFFFYWFLVLWGARRNARNQARCARLHWQTL